MNELKTYIWTGYSHDSLCGFGVDAESRDEATNVLCEKLDVGDWGCGILECEGVPLAACCLVGSDKK